MYSLARALFYVFFFASICLMLADFLLGTVHVEMIFFYMLANGILVFRVIQVTLIIKVIHAAVFLCLLVIYAAIDGEKMYKLNAFIIMITTLVQFVLGLYLMALNPGESKGQRACQAGAHAYFGILVMILYFWIISFACNFNDSQCILEMFYMMCFLFMILIPNFQSSKHAVQMAVIECNRNMGNYSDGAREACISQCNSIRSSCPRPFTEDSYASQRTSCTSATAPCRKGASRSQTASTCVQPVNPCDRFLTSRVVVNDYCCNDRAVEPVNPCCPTAKRRHSSGNLKNPRCSQPDNSKDGTNSSCPCTSANSNLRRHSMDNLHRSSSSPKRCDHPSFKPRRA